MVFAVRGRSLPSPHVTITKSPSLINFYSFAMARIVSINWVDSIPWGYTIPEIDERYPIYLATTTDGVKAITGQGGLSLQTFNAEFPELVKTIIKLAWIE